MEPIKTKSKSSMYVMVGLVAVLVVVGLWLSNKKSVEEVPVVTPVENTPSTPNPSSSAGSVSDPDKEGTSVGSGAGKYATLMLTYKGRMIQFNKECAVITNKQGFKQGTDILLDNRDNTPVKIVIGSRTFNLPGYGYKVIDLPTIGSFQLDCNQRLNVVTVTVQK
jgi:hypothetical protein